MYYTVTLSNGIHRVDINWRKYVINPRYFPTFSDSIVGLRLALRLAFYRRVGRVPTQFEIKQAEKIAISRFVHGGYRYQGFRDLFKTIVPENCEEENDMF